MAWISVHEQVIGGKLRNLAKKISCSQNEALGILIRFWLWGINNADKYGIIIGADMMDVADVLVTGLSKDLNAESVVESLIESGWIDCENNVLYIHDWDEWQEQWYKMVEARKGNAERQKKWRDKKKQELPPVSESDFLKQEQKSERKAEQKPKAAASGYSSGFEMFWKVYPRKVGKGEAYKKYKARLNDGWSEAELLEAAKNYAGRVSRERTEQKYIKHAKTFLSENTPFTDFLTKWKDAGQQVLPDDGDDPYERSRKLNSE